MDAAPAAVHFAAAATVATAVLPTDAVLLVAFYPERVDGPWLLMWLLVLRETPRTLLQC